MIQHRGSLSNFFIKNAYKLKNKQGVSQTYLVLNLKNRCVCFSKQQNNENMYLKKPKTFFVKKLFFILTMLLFDFTTLIKQIIVKRGYFFYKNTIKKVQGFSKKHRCFYKNSIYVFLPQDRLKEQ